MVTAAGAQASLWPVAGGGASRSGAQPVEPGALPAERDWSAGVETVRTPPVITGGAGPAAQRVAYGTADGRVHLRALNTGGEIGPAGGTLVADAPLTDASVTFGPGIAFASTSTDLQPGVLFVVHNDGAGVEIARFDERSGTRIGPDAALADSLGCAVAGAPLLTPVATDGTRFLVFTIQGACPRGTTLVRVPVAADPAAALGTPTSAPVPELQAGVAPALVVAGDPAQFTVAVARSNGIDLWRVDGDFLGAPDATISLSGDPVALAAPETAPVATPALVAVTDANGRTQVTRLDQGADGAFRTGPVATLEGAPRGGLALGGVTEPRIVVTTSAGVTVLQAADLSSVATAPGAASGVSAAGDLGFVVRSGRLVAIRLTDATVVELSDAPAAFAPALARGYVALGPLAVRTTDVTSPAVAMPADAHGLRLLSAIASDDRGVARVTWRLSGRRLAAATAPASGSPFAPGAQYERAYAPRTIAPGGYVLAAVARDGAGNVGRAQRPVSVACGRTVRGGRRRDVLHGRRGRDCLYGGAGADRLLARDKSPDALFCGRGRDVVRSDRFDRVADDCERVRRP
ncbi:MAG: hypothetical protein QOI80_2905 [Solirubrobacteraceae bacterium]|nr:hypothetical protein [Solirubrobacteraceae bacterium]